MANTSPVGYFSSSELGNAPGHHHHQQQQQQLAAAVKSHEALRCGHARRGARARTVAEDTWPTVARGLAENSGDVVDSLAMVVGREHGGQSNAVGGGWVCGETQQPHIKHAAVTTAITTTTVTAATTVATATTTTVTAATTATTATTTVTAATTVATATVSTTVLPL
ncbi:unnamed protein product [Lampetra fluviatilis]